MPGGGGKETQPDLAAAGSDVFILDMTHRSCVPDPVIQLRPADFIHTKFSRGRALYFIYLYTFCQTGHIVSRLHSFISVLC